MLAGAGSDAGEYREALPVVVLVAEEQLARLGPAEVQVRAVLPGEADAAVHLDGLGRHMEVRLGAVGLGDRRRHAEFFRDLAERAEPTLLGTPDGRTWNAQLERDHDNVRAALAWSMSADGVLAV